MARNKKLAFLLFFALLAGPLKRCAAGSFQQGRGRLSLHAASGSAFNQDYLVVGGGGGFFVWDGLELGLDGEVWTGAHPGIYKVSPQVKYVWAPGPGISYYAGGFYRRSWIESLKDLDSIGGRAGIYQVLGNGLYAGLGVVYERYLDCDEGVYGKCETVLPEVNLSVSF